MDRNPFHPVVATDQAEHFCGRRSEVSHALRSLRRLNSVEVCGPRRIGKTMFLHYISHPVTMQEYGIDPQSNVFAYIDCQRGLDQAEETQVYRMVLEHIWEAASRAGISCKPPGQSPAGTVFEGALREMSSRGLRIILILDEFDAMAQNPRLGDHFLGYLRALGSAGDINLDYVTASCVSMADLCMERQALSGSPFFNIFRPVRLGLLNEQDSRHLVEDSLRKAGTRFPRDLLELVLEAGGGHPFLLQMAGYQAFELAVIGEELAREEREVFLERVEIEAKSHFKSHWQKLDAQERYVLAALPSLQNDLGYRETIEHLRDQCLIVRDSGRWDYFSPLLEAFVRRQKASGLG